MSIESGDFDKHIMKQKIVNKILINLLNMFKKISLGNNILEVAYLRKKIKKSKRKNIIITASILIILWIFSFYIYTTYNNIEINTADYEVARTQSTIEAQTV